MTDRRAMWREASRRRRARLRNGLVSVRLELPDLPLEEMLTEAGDLAPLGEDDPEEIRAALQRFLLRALSRHA